MSGIVGTSFGAVAQDRPAVGEDPVPPGGTSVAASPAGARLAVVVPTFRRPESLLRTLASLAAQTVADFPIVVVDNDPRDQEGLAAATAWGRECGRQKLLASHVAEPGLSGNRNAGLAIAFGAFDVEAALMIDDDTIAAPDLVERMSAALASTEAGLIGGPTVYTFPEHTPARIRDLELFGVPWKVTGPVPRLRSANNCVVRRRFFEAYGPKLFDPAFSRSGGEDSHLFRRSERLGEVAFWVADARCFEFVPAERCTDSWAITRNRLSAMNSARIAVLLDGRWKALRMQSALAVKEAIGGVLRFVRGSLPAKGAMAVEARRTERLVARQRLAGALARIEGVLGRSPSHYASPSPRSGTPGNAPQARSTQGEVGASTGGVTAGASKDGAGPPSSPQGAASCD